MGALGKPAHFNTEFKSAIHLFDFLPTTPCNLSELNLRRLMGKAAEWSYSLGVGFVSHCGPILMFGFVLIGKQQAYSLITSSY